LDLENKSNLEKEKLKGKLSATGFFWRDAEFFEKIFGWFE